MVRPVTVGCLPAIQPPAQARQHRVRPVGPWQECPESATDAISESKSGAALALAAHSEMDAMHSAGTNPNEGDTVSRARENRLHGLKRGRVA